MTMGTGEPQGAEPLEIPENAVLVKPSNWAWLWYCTPWLAFGVASFFFDAISFGLFPIVIGGFFVLPQYMRWRSTVYILTDEYLLVKRGTRQLYNVPFSEVTEVRRNPGLFGNSLGYAAIYLVLKDGRSAFLSHVPRNSGLVEYVLAHTDALAPQEGKPEA